MSGAEQDAAIIRLVKQRGDAKRRRVLLENELRTAGHSLYEIGMALRGIAASGSFNSTPDYVLPKLAKAPEICNMDKIKVMLEELRDLETTLTQLNRSATELGID